MIPISARSTAPSQSASSSSRWSVVTQGRASLQSALIVAPEQDGEGSEEESDGDDVEQEDRTNMVAVVVSDGAVTVGVAVGSEVTVEVAVAVTVAVAVAVTV